MECVVEVCNVSKKIGSRKILQNISMSVGKGEIYALLGANGAGKTTLMKMLFGMLKPDAGKVIVLGEKIDFFGKNEVFGKMGNIIESPTFYYNLTAEENMDVHCRYMDRKFESKIPEILREVGLFDLDKKKVSEFSLGMKQRLAIARAIIVQPQILVLDEPINGLDPMGISDIRCLLKKMNEEQGTTILISSHIIEEVSKLAHTIGIIDAGVMLEEKNLKEILCEEQDLEKYFTKVVLRGRGNVRTY